MIVKKKMLADTIWNAIFADLYDRSQFDWWWDNIDYDIKSEIEHSIIKIINKTIKNGNINDN